MTRSMTSMFYNILVSAKNDKHLIDDDIESELVKKGKITFRQFHTDSEPAYKVTLEVKIEEV